MAANTGSGEDATTRICWFGHTCHGELEELGLQVDIDLHRAIPRIARVRVHGRRLGCCYFQFGRDDTAIDLRGVTVHREPIFKGVATSDGTIENQRVGSLYLNLRLLAPDRDDGKGLQPI